MTQAKARPLFDPEIVVPAIAASFTKLNPIHLWKNPVMFVTEVGAAVTTLELIFNRGGGSLPVRAPDQPLALVHRAVRQFRRGDGRGARQSPGGHAAQESAHDDGEEARTRRERPRPFRPRVCARATSSSFRRTRPIPADGEIIEGAATVDESAITGESAPVIREAGGDRSAVTGGTTVLSDEIKVRVTANPGESFMDRMIELIEGAKRQRTPNEIALSILLSALTIIFLVVCITFKPFAIYTSSYAGDAINQAVTVTVLISLLVCLIPTTIGGLLSAIGIAGIDRMVQKNVLAMSGRAVEAAGDVDVLLLDKTGTITLGNRQATEFVPAPGASERELAEAAQLCSLADETPEGRSIVVLAKEKYNMRGREIHEMPHATFVPFTAQTRMSGVDIDGQQRAQGRSRQCGAVGGQAVPRAR